MLDNLRFELSFKNNIQLKNKIEFCIANKINRINIPCKGIIKKKFLTETIEYLGKNYNQLDIIYHFSIYHQYSKNKENSYLEFLDFINKCFLYNNKEILLISGSKKKKGFDTIQVLDKLRKEKKQTINLGIAYNPYLNSYFNIIDERNRLKEKLASGLVNSIWLQFGTDINLLNNEIKYLKNLIAKNTYNSNISDVNIYGSLLIPSKQFLARFKFRPWNGVYISDEYLSSLNYAYRHTIDLLDLYLENNIYPIIETDCSSIEKLNQVYRLLKM